MSSEITFSCEHCAQHLEAPQEMAGEVLECPSCNGRITVPPLIEMKSPVQAPVQERRPSPPRRPQQPFIELQAQSCPNCGGQINVSGRGGQDIKCEFCGTGLRVVRPVKVSEASDADLTAEEEKRYGKLITILENAMVAGNYREGYEYCNKLLEINPQAAQIWENKAICSYWLSTKQNLVEDEAREVVTYLRTARQYDPQSQTLNVTSEAIAWSMFSLSYFWLYVTQPDMPNNMFSVVLCQEMLKYVKLWDIAFDIHNDISFLKEAVSELSGHGKINWPGLEKQLSTSGLRQSYINKIKRIEPSYDPPKIKGTCFVATATLGTPDHPIIRLLCDFRDQCLMESHVGRAWVRLYYNIGPYLAVFIAKRPYLRPFVRTLVIKPMAWLAQSIMRHQADSRR